MLQRDHRADDAGPGTAGRRDRTGSASCATSSATRRRRSSSCPARIEAVEDRLPAARADDRRLDAYADAAWAPVAGNLEEARKGLAGARDAVIVGSAAWPRDDRSGRRRRDAGGARGGDRRGRRCSTRSTRWRPPSRTPSGGSPASSPRPTATSHAAPRSLRAEAPTRGRRRRCATPTPPRRHCDAARSAGRRAARPTRSRRCAWRPRPTGWPTRRCSRPGTRPRPPTGSWPRPTRRSGPRPPRSTGRRRSSRRGDAASARRPGRAWPRRSAISMPAAASPRHDPAGAHRAARRAQALAAGGLPARRRTTSPTGTRAGRAGASASGRQRRPDGGDPRADPRRGHRRRPVGGGRRAAAGAARRGAAVAVAAVASAASAVARRRLGRRRRVRLRRLRRWWRRWWRPRSRGGRW